jgi:hypothetical protein
MRSLLLLLTLILCACPPVRDDVVVGDGTGGPSYLQSAVWFTWGEPTREYEIGVLQMVGADYGCEDAVAFDIQWWTLDPEVDWITLGQLKGVNHANWEMAFDSYYAWSVDDGGFDFPSAAYFYGTFGASSQQNGWDDDDEEPPFVGRDVQGYLGQEASQVDDLLTISSHSDTRVTGVATGQRNVDGQLEDYRFNFNAENCGLLGGQSVPGDEADGGEDNGGDGNFR